MCKESLVGTISKLAQMAEEGSGRVSSALSSLWSASSDKDDTCRTWGLVSVCNYRNLSGMIAFAEQERADYGIFYMPCAGSHLFWPSMFEMWLIVYTIML